MQAAILRYFLWEERPLPSAGIPTTELFRGEPRLRELVAGAQQMGLTLTPEQLRAFQAYYEELVAWNARFNLTAITDYRQVQIQHFLDSLSCLLAKEAWVPRPDRPPGPLALADVGSGAGFPGLPLKIVRPRLRLTLIEARRKKVEFLEHMIRLLGLKDVTVLHGRAEEIGQKPRYREYYDLVTARAVAELPVLAEYMLPLCRLGGFCIAQKGHDAWQEVMAAERAVELLGGRVERLIPVTLPGLAETRHLVLIAKVARTPPQYPRRPGIPSKRPLK